MVGKNLLLVIATLTAMLLIGTMAIQPVLAPRDCGNCVHFKKLTHEFEKNVIRVIGDPNQGPQPHLRELLQAYSQKVQRIFIGDPNLDQVKTLLQSYEQDVIRIFDVQPPEPDKQLIKEFKGLTHDFVKAVIGAVQPPEPE
jgi:hypothetical protein